MNHFYATPRGADELPQALAQTREAALLEAGVAACRFIDSHSQSDFSILRMAVCRAQMYDRLAAELEAGSAVRQ